MTQTMRKTMPTLYKIDTSWLDPYGFTPEQRTIIDGLLRRQAVATTQKVGQMVTKYCADILAKSMMEKGITMSARSILSYARNEVLSNSQYYT